MFPTTETYLYNGCYLHVLNKTHQLFDDIKYINTGNIYLGRYLYTRAIYWNENIFVKNGEAVFEYGRILFPNYRNIEINRTKTKLPPVFRNRSISWRDGDSIINIQDIYPLVEKITNK